MRTPSLGALILLSALLLACSSPQAGVQPAASAEGETPAASEPPPASVAARLDHPAVGDAAEGLVLPDLQGRFSLGDEPAKRLDQVDVTISADGTATLGRLVYAEPWRGIELPRAGPVTATPTLDLNDVRVKLVLAAGGVIARIGNRRCTSWNGMASEIEGNAARMVATGGQHSNFVLDAQGDVPAGHVVTVLAVLLQQGLPVSIAAAQAGEAAEIDPDLHEALATLTSGVRRDEFGSRLVGARLRADARAPWGAVQRTLGTVTRALIGHVTFVGVLDGVAVDLYPRRRGDADSTAGQAALAVAGGAQEDQVSQPQPQVVETPIIVLEEEVEVAGEPTATEQPLVVAPEEQPLELPDDLNLDDLGDDDLDVDLPGLDEDDELFSDRPGVPAPYAQRGDRAAQLEAEGGSEGTEAAVGPALRWLVHHQRADGSWDAEGWTAQCGRGQGLPACAGAGANAGDPSSDLGVTALSLIALLGQGDPGSGPYGASLQAGLQWLQAQQREDGGFGEVGLSGDMTTYPQPLATIALCEAYTLTGDAALEQPARRALGFCLLAQNPGLGWKYGVKPGRNDTAVTGWMTAALRAGELAGFDVPPEAYKGALSWFKRATASSGEVGYETPGGGSAFLLPNDGKFDLVPAMTAVSLHARLSMGEARDVAELRRAVELLAESPPTWGAEDVRKVNYYYWYQGTNAMFQAGGPGWGDWNKAMQAALLPHQRMGGCEDGSWDPVGEWCLSGGRVYATAINALSLQAYYRFQRR